jgi:hypothetical protein
MVPSFGKVQVSFVRSSLAVGGIRTSIAMNATKIACHDGVETIKAQPLREHPQLSVDIGSAFVKSLRPSTTEMIAPTQLGDGYILSRRCNLECCLLGTFH